MKTAWIQLQWQRATSQIIKQGAEPHTHTFCNHMHCHITVLSLMWQVVHYYPMHSAAQGLNTFFVADIIILRGC